MTGVMTGLVTLRNDPSGCPKALIQRRAWSREKDPDRHAIRLTQGHPWGGMRGHTRIEVVIQIFLSDSQGKAAYFMNQLKDVVCSDPNAIQLIKTFFGSVTNASDS